MKRIQIVFYLISLCLLMGCKTPINMHIVEMQVEMRNNPDGIGVTFPRFSWQLQTGIPNVMQTAYQIEVAASPEDLKTGNNLLWNSGKVESDVSILISYAGKTLESGKTYYWKTTVWTNYDNTVQSAQSKWSMGLLNISDWKAQWIGINDPENVMKDSQGRTRLSARYLRKEFTTPQNIKQAMLYISGIGSSVCYLNGLLASNDVFAPLPTLYTSTVYYNTYDVTSLLQNGQNTIGVALGNGRYLAMREPEMVGFGLPRLIAQLDIEYENGQHDLIVSNETWQATNKGPIIANNEFDGEEYDARKELGRWTETGYDASLWKNADLMEEPGGALIAQTSDNIKVMETIQPISVKTTANSTYILDIGQNMVGWLHVSLKGKKDSPITLRFAESLKTGVFELHLDNLRGALATDIYIPSTDGTFSWEPMFVSHGFRFVEISGLDYKPETTDFIGKVIYDNMPTIGTFETSDELANQIYKNAYWGIRGNYRGMPTDCPQRDERLGWLGDRTTGAYGESFIFRNALLYNKWMKDIEDSMNENGSISVVSPRYRTIYNEDITRSSTFFYVSDMLYKQFGDISAIKTHYPAMKRWVQHQIDTQIKDYILINDTYGDWNMPPESQTLIYSQDPTRRTNGQVLSTSVFYSILQLMSEFAIINGIASDAAAYKELAAKIKDAYNEKFFNFETAQYDNNTVTANILSQQLGLVPAGYEERVFQNIVTKTEKEFRGHVSTGVMGLQHLMRGLTKYKHVDLAWRIATNETYPSWGYMVEQDATTIWEHWNGDKVDPAMNSSNHVMLLGDLVIWFYENLAGIQNDSQSVAFKQIKMKPIFPQGVEKVDASYQSPYGLIESHWVRNRDRFVWYITIPANTTAVVELPANFNIRQPIHTGVSAFEKTDELITIKLGSGRYELTSE